MRRFPVKEKLNVGKLGHNVNHLNDGQMSVHKYLLTDCSVFCLVLEKDLDKRRLLYLAYCLQQEVNLYMKNTMK